ncbi:MAG: CerR family C-terminal domain-containing protein [Desulfomonilaceae bacterium]|nr:CerR family C-terminal domain-containing protein [Desulfomonilaceae bacterium]
MLADDPRTRLIETALDLFGQYSFDGVSTRMLAERAEVNLAAIKYYFGSKEGLYLAVAEQIVQHVGQFLGPRMAKVQESLDGDELTKEESFNLLCELLEFFITRLLALPETGKWLKIIFREQLCPTQAFDILFDGFMRPLDQVLFGLVARIVGRNEDDLEVRLRVFSIMGQIQVFNVSPSSIKRTLNWDQYNPDNLEAIRCVIMDNLNGIFSMSRNGVCSAQTR